MAESEYSFGTSILTNKTPEQAALIIPNCLTSSSNLIERSLLGWFKDYTDLLQKHNKELQTLLNQGSAFFNPNSYHDEFGSFSKSFNSLLSAIQTEVSANEQLFKNLKLETYSPLRDLTDKDVRYSELVVNSQELQEISADLSSRSPNAEYQWNAKAPQAFNNFENYKKYEKQLLFDIILNFFNSQSVSLSKQLQNNENTVNYLLGFKLDDEMKSYLDFLLKSQFKPVNNRFGLQNYSAKAGPRSGSTSQQRKSVTSQEAGGAGASNPPTSTSSKRSSKLRSKVGSIFGRKSKKNAKDNSLSGINETDSLNSSALQSTENLSNARTRDSLASGRGLSSDLMANKQSNTRSTNVTGGPNYTSVPSGGQREPVSKERNLSETPSYQGSRSETQQRPSSKVSGSQPVPQNRYPQTFNQPQATTIAPQSVQGGSNAEELPQKSINGYQPPSRQPSVKTPSQNFPTINSAPLTPQHGGFPSAGPPPADSPNVVKYNHDTSSSDSTSSSDLGPGDSKRVSMLRKHAPMESEELDDHFPSSRQNRVDSFEAGDEKGILNTPSRDQRNEFESGFPEPDINGIESSEYPSRQESPVYQNVKIPGAMESPTREPVDTIPENQESHFMPPRNDSITPDYTNVSGFQPGLERKSSTRGVAPPAPPPSRKVIHRPTQPGPDERELSNEAGQTNIRRGHNSQLFHNLPPARDSIIAPPNPPLVKQETGSSLMKGDIFKHFEGNGVAEYDGLNTSIAEVLNVMFQNGQLTESRLVGEIAFFYKSPEGYDGYPNPIILKIPNRFEKEILNHSILERFDDNETFRLDPRPIVSRTLGGLKYLATLTDAQVPVLVNQIWKYEDHQSSLMVSVKLNPQYSRSVRLSELVISASLDLSSAAYAASSKPQGSFSRERNRITWRFTEPLLLSANHPEEKFIARFSTYERGREHENGVQLKFSIQEAPQALVRVHKLDREISEVPSIRNLVTGSFSSHSQEL